MPLASLLMTVFDNFFIRLFEFFKGGRSNRDLSLVILKKMEYYKFSLYIRYFPNLLNK